MLNENDFPLLFFYKVRRIKNAGRYSKKHATPLSEPATALSHRGCNGHRRHTPDVDLTGPRKAANLNHPVENGQPRLADVIPE